MYISQMKLIDQTLNPVTGKKSYEKFMYAAFFGKTINLVPNIKDLGCIIRVHRGRNKKARGVYELNCAINGIGAWTLFDINGNSIQQSGKSYTFTENDKEILREISKFDKDFFEKYDFKYENIEYARSKELKDFNIVCGIIDINFEAKYAYLKICDQENEAMVEISKGNTEKLEKFNIIKIANANFKNKDIIIMNEHSNIMKIPKDFQISQKILEAIKTKYHIS